MTLSRSICEWGYIPYGEGADEIPEVHADRIAALAKASGFSGGGAEGVLEHGRKGLRARGIVGVIATPGFQLEILPKIEGAGEEAGKGVEKGTLRRRLIDMLAVAHDLPVETGAMTGLGWQSETVLEVLIGLFCHKLAEAVRQGLPRLYVNHEDDLPALRGRLNVTRQFSTLAATPHRLACRHDVLSPDIALNHVMRATVSRLSGITLSPDNRRALRELALVYDGIADLSARAIAWERITLDRTNGRWRDLLAFARLFLSGRYQQTSLGNVSGHTLLFPMNTLFEKYIEQVLRLALVESGHGLTAQGGHLSCLYEGHHTSDDKKGRFRTRPDLIVRNGKRIPLIIDTKWKRMVPRIDDPKQGISQSDVYQLMAYAQLYDCDRVMLLYPHHGDLPQEQIHQTYNIAEPGAEKRLIVATHDLVAPRAKQTASLRELVLGKE
ncbi:restriction endonuclease [Sinirhodobacter populi]|nr:restriction endonuclease [Sinirhodobacter populi]